MGCGVSKEDIAEPSRIQQVVVRDGSPTKSHEETAQDIVNTTPVTLCNTDTATATPCTSPATSKLPPPPTPAPPAESPEHIVANGTPVLPFPFPSSNGDTPCTKSPEAKTSAVTPARTSNGLVGTLASLEEILNGQEPVSINSKLKVSADKIVSYGGVLRSLEDTVELQTAAEEEEQNMENEAEEEQEAESGSVLESEMSPAGSNRDGSGSPATLPSLEAARKKLPPLATPPSFMIDKGTDPFVKAPLPTQLLKSLTTANTYDIPASPIDLSSHVPLPPLPSPPPPHSTTTAMVSMDHVKDITVVNGAPGFDHEKCSSPKEWTSLEELHRSEDAELENIILLETLEAGDSSDGDYSSRVNHINHNIRVTSLTSELGVSSSNGQQSPYSSSSR